MTAFEKRTKLLLSFTLLLILCQGTVFTQSIQYSALPQHLQLYPRDSTDSATVAIAGQVLLGGQDSLVLSVYQDSLPPQRQAWALSYSGGQAPFSLQPRIPAVTSEFRFEIALVSGPTSTVQTVVDSVVCGDVYLVSGQSNAIPESGTPYGYRNEFCRSFGKITTTDPYDPADTLWGLATGIGWNPGYYGVGTWALDLMRIIREQNDVPVAILNGAVLGSTIEYNLPNVQDSTDLNSTYGRLLYRARKAKVADKARAFIWIQGESGMSIPNYAASFDTLYQAWHTNYPKLEHIYAWQIGMNYCGVADKQALREIQRNFRYQYTDVEVLPCNGIVGFQGCHWGNNGYFVFADWMFGMLDQDFYAGSLGVEAFPPRIEKATFTTHARDEIALIFEDDQVVTWDTMHVFFGDSFYLRDHIYFDDSVTTVLGGRAANDTVLLTLGGPSQATHMTYLPDIFYENSGYAYRGPFIKSMRGMTALTFHDYPIQVLVGTETGDHPQALKISPNPATSTARIQWPAGISKATLTLLDAKGRKLLSKMIPQSNFENETKLDLAALPPGIYFIRLADDERQLTGRLLLSQ